MNQSTLLLFEIFGEVQDTGDQRRVPQQRPFKLGTLGSPTKFATAVI